MKKLVLWIAGLWVGGIGLWVGGSEALLVLVACSAGFVLAGITGTEAARVIARKQYNTEGKATHYSLQYRDESVTLEPGKPWPRTDSFKWVTRGLIEEPQSFQVLANGMVEINAERIALEDTDGEAKLELQINKHHPPSLAHKPPVIPVRMEEQTADAARVHFRVKLDHLGHLLIESTRGAERAETGLRGLPTLVQSGFMIRPAHFHVDPLQRALELDGVRYECNAEGATQLETILNERYAPALQQDDTTQILVRANAASATGFDIEFVSLQAGSRVQIKGHLSQDKLNVLQDPQRCELLHPGIILRLSPPNLLIRRRRPDGGEESIPGLQDISYLRIEASQLQQLLNHPLVRRCKETQPQPLPSLQPTAVDGIEQIRVMRNPQARLFLWLECQHRGGKRDGRAFTHHNVTELMQRGVFQEQRDISLSIDNHRLSVLNLASRQEQSITLSSSSSDDDLAHASALLTEALKPMQPRQLTTTGASNL